MVDDILITWTIRTFDRRLKTLSPLPKHYVLDRTKASESEQAEIMKIFGTSDGPDEQKPKGLGARSETLSVGNRPDERMLRFRQMFVEKPIEEIKRFLNGGGPNSHRVFKSVNLHRDYFEDETGREITMREMMQIANGNKNEMFIDAESVVQLGPCAIRAREKWAVDKTIVVDKANTLFNFIQVVGLIWRSSWARKKISITTNSDNDGKTNITCDFPAVESMCAVLTLFRQLYASDALMERTCDIYMEHASNEIKKQWVDYCLDRKSVV